MENITLSGALATLILELIKWVVRKIKGDPEFDFPTLFYTIMIPVLTFAVGPLLALIGYEGYTFPVDWSGWLMELVRIALGSVVALVGYNAGLRPLKEYNRRLLSEG